MIDIDLRVKSQAIKSSKSYGNHFYKGTKGGAVRLHFSFAPDWKDFPLRFVTFQLNGYEEVVQIKSDYAEIPDAFCNESHEIRVTGTTDRKMSKVINTRPFRIKVGG